MYVLAYKVKKITLEHPLAALEAYIFHVFHTWFRQVHKYGLHSILHAILFAWESIQHHVDQSYLVVLYEPHFQIIKSKRIDLVLNWNRYLEITYCFHQPINT